ncbi:glycosyltransferase family 4 protein [Labrenzia sp. CE80]|uniref:glycosyltransferase family 4 protein n=1 Tax=Labrenzia sp. CE80 TaxID=1788986 RepID=UPI00129AA003|nr:glycosyltransferase family 4 protein [Labrenzia sp. CE80]
MKIAFTAPMKPLDHPVPSGDRTMGRLIVQALESRGHDVRVASRFRSWSKDSGEDVQRAIRDEALAEADRVAGEWLAEGYRPDVFLTYHLYHKAPDWIGPTLADKFGIAYAIVEASRAPKRKTGLWAFGFEAADAALARADQVAALHKADSECLADVVYKDRLRVLLPFLDADPFEEAARHGAATPHFPLKLLTVGMMRDGDKTRSYEVLADALARVSDLPWELTIIGDGPNRESILARFPETRVRCLGAMEPEDLPDLYAAHDLFVWPAIREAFGFVFLEAQAAGLGVVAGDTFGVPDIVRHGETGLLSPEGDAKALAANLRQVLEAPERAKTLGDSARAHIAANHRLEAGARRLDAMLEAALDQRWDRTPSPSRPAIVPDQT